MHAPTSRRHAATPRDPRHRASSFSCLLRAAALLLTAVAAPSGNATAQSSVRHADLSSIDGQLWHATVYDEARERVVLFGKEQTWEWNGATWLRRSSAQSPPDLDRHAMAYDAARRRVVLFGGVTGSRVPYGSVTNGTPNAETWEWDGNEWLQRLPAASPSPRGDHSMVYDTGRQRVVLFGGAGVGDTWEWDGVDWHQRAPSTSPPPSTRAPMAYDAQRQVTVLAVDSTTWEWDGTDWRLAARNGPSGTAIVYDTTLGRVVLFGSTGAWEWDGAIWSPISRTPQPGARKGASSAYDAARGETVFCGGTIDTGSRLALQPVQTWVWDGATWALRHVGDGTMNALIHRSILPATPGNRSYAYDSVRHVFVSLSSYGTGGTGGGSQGEPSYSYSTSTREWDGRRWTARGAGPLRGYGDAMTFDSTRAVTVQFGGYAPNRTAFGAVILDETWEWDGVHWQNRQPAVRPKARGHLGLAFDSQRGVTVLFGGEVDYSGDGSVPFDDTWEWDGTTWSHRTSTTAPPARYGHAMAFDPRRGVTVVFGGLTFGGGYPNPPIPLADTWEWDGTDWRQVPTGGPPAGGGHAMAWDPSRNRIVLYAYDELWSFDGSSWGRVATNTPLPQANGGAMAFDDNRQALIVVGNGITRLIGEVATASSLPIGVGCPGADGVPRISSERPRLGSGDVRVTLSDAQHQAQVLFGLSPAQHSTRLGGGCTLYVGTPVAWFAAQSNTHGYAEISLIMPFAIALRGLELFGQAVVLDPQGSASGLALSQGIRLRIGD